jgi:GNAT superfamily N-acetyltransferase
VSTISLRRGGPSDRAFVLDLGSRSTSSSVSSLRPAPEPLVVASYARLVDFAFDNAYVLLIAETSLDGPVGFVLMIENLPDEVTGLAQSFVAYMAVEPDAQRHGIGARLLQAAEDAARENGHSHMALMVTEDNLAARELYAQAGYATERRLLCKAL